MSPCVITPKGTLQDQVKCGQPLSPSCSAKLPPRTCTVKPIDSVPEASPRHLKKPHTSHRSTLIPRPSTQSVAIYPRPQDHFCFSTSRISVSSVSSFDGAAGAAGASSSFRFSAFIPLMTTKIANAMITKSTTVWMSMP